MSIVVSEAIRSYIPLAPKIAIIAALEHELRTLIKGWPSRTIHHEERQFKVYESSYAAVICSGIGAEAGRRAAEAVIANYAPALLISAGIAGALVPELHVGETIFPEIAIDAGDSSRHQSSIKATPISDTPLAKTIVVSYPEIAGAEQKRKLGKAYNAHAVDMESASVARAAEAHGLPFIAIKSISDEVDFEMPEMMPFFKDGQFQSVRFAIHVGLRPWLWFRVLLLARNTQVAADNLCAWLRESVLINTIVLGTYPVGREGVPE
jgi:adenosylhomocysteine nucleosidase